jgi:hypothetical protein
MSRKRVVLSIAVLVVLVLIVAVPAFAGGKEPVGTRVNLFAGDQEVSGPFHVMHGYAFPPPSSATAIGKTDFSLAIDGTDLEGRFISFKSGDALVQLTLYNFEDGLPPGQYTLTGTWHDLCWMYERQGLECDLQKNDIVPYIEEIQLTVN